MTTAEWSALLGNVSADWSQSSVLDTTVVAGAAKSRNCRGADGRIEVCNGTYGFNRWLGLAQIWMSGVHIVRGSARVNDTYFATASLDNPQARRHVLCQELGHCLGLDHQTATSCMDDVNGLADPAYVSPNAHDDQQLGLIYAHLDATSTASAASAGASSPDGGDDPSGPRHHRGRPHEEVYVKDLGGGYKLVSFVLWVE